MAKPESQDFQALAPAHAVAFAIAAEQSPLPVLLCDAQATVLAAGKVAHHLLAQNAGLLALDHGRLRLTGHEQQRQLLEFIERALAGEAPGPRDSTLVMKLDRGETPLTLLISGVAGASEPLAAIYLHEPAFTARISEALLCELHTLTQAEARVARLLVNGASTHEIAEHNNTSLHTVRNQIKSVFNKTGATRQAELAILLLTGPAHTR